MKIFYQISFTSSSLFPYLIHFGAFTNSLLSFNKRLITMLLCKVRPTCNRNGNGWVERVMGGG